MNLEVGKANLKPKRILHFEFIFIPSIFLGPKPFQTQIWEYQMKYSASGKNSSCGLGHDYEYELDFTTWIRV